MSNGDDRVRAAVTAFESIITRPDTFTPQQQATLAQAMVFAFRAYDEIMLREVSRAITSSAVAVLGAVR